jgi:hypothetical protein
MAYLWYISFPGAKDFSFSNIILSVLSFVLIAKVKVYILLDLSRHYLYDTVFN